MTMKEGFKILFFVFSFMIIFCLLCGLISWGYQASRVYYERSVMYPALRGDDIRLLIPFKIKAEDEEFRLGEVYIDKQGYMRQKRGE